MQGVGLGLVPLAMAVAREDLPPKRSGPTIAVLGITTAAGIGVGYPLAGLCAQYLGLYAAFWFGAGVGAAAFVAALVVLPASPSRRARVDVTGAVLLGLAIAGLLLFLAEGPVWGWTSTAALVAVAVAVLLLAGWVVFELRTRYPLFDLRLLRHRSVLAANVTGLLISIGFYPLMSLVVRFVQTPRGSGYGFGAPVIIASLMLAPSSLASFAASRLAKRAAHRTSPEWVVVAGTVVLIAALSVFVIARSAYWQVIVVMALQGFAVGCVFAVNPLQIVAGVPDHETSSAMSFYQLVRTVGYSVGSAVSATALVLSTPAGGAHPTNAGYSLAALVSITVSLLGLAAGTAFAFRRAISFVDSQDLTGARGGGPLRRRS